MKTLRLNNGYEIPVVGTGTNTFGKEGNVFSGTITYDTTELRSAIELGYRLIVNFMIQIIKIIIALKVA